MSRYYAETKDGKKFSYGFEFIGQQYFLIDEIAQVTLVGQGSDFVHGNARNLQTALQENGFWESVPENHRLDIVLDLTFRD